MAMMRGSKSFIGLLVVLLALGAYLYFVESKRTPGDADEKPDVFAGLEADAIEQVTVTSESGEVTTLEKSDAGWRITAPAAADADTAEVSGITSSLASLEEQRLIDENPSDLQAYGLATPRVRIAFSTGGQERTLLLGGKTPTGADLYAKTAAEPKVFLISAYLDSTFNRSTFDLRDKRALAFDREAADSIEIATPEQTLRFGKTDSQWQMRQPEGSRSDPATIESLVSRLDGLQMKAMASTDPQDLKPYGLDTPSATVKIGTGSSQATLLIGKATGEETVYAKDASRPAVFTLEASLLDELKKDANEYRQKDLFEARAFNTNRVEIVRAGDTLAFERTPVKDKDGQETPQWRRVAPADGEVDGGKVDALLSALTSARADSFAERAPAKAQTEAVLTLKYNEGRREERVTFLRAGELAYAVRDGGDVAAQFPATTLDGILTAIDALK